MRWTIQRQDINKNANNEVNYIKTQPRTKLHNNYIKIETFAKFNIDRMRIIMNFEPILRYIVTLHKITEMCKQLMIYLMP